MTRFPICYANKVAAAVASIAVWLATGTDRGDAQEQQPRSAPAAPIEIRLREEPVVPRGIIRLGHVADVLGTTSARRRHLERIPIRPAPRSGESVTVRRADLRRVLHFESGAIPSFEFTGPEAVRLGGRAATAPVQAPRSPSSRNVSRAAAPAEEGTRVVVARRALPRGRNIAMEDVTVVSLTGDELAALHAVSWTDDLDQVVGKELQRAIRAGAPIPPDATAPPMMVRHREGVEVTAHAGACVVRMTAVAMENGRLGEMVRLQNPNGKGYFIARVTGPNRAEVGTPRVASAGGRESIRPTAGGPRVAVPRGGRR